MPSCSWLVSARQTHPNVPIPLGLAPLQAVAGPRRVASPVRAETESRGWTQLDQSLDWSLTSLPSASQFSGLSVVTSLGNTFGITL